MGRRDNDGEDWLGEVADALAELGLFDTPTREALLETVRDAVRDALPERPPVTVLPGGRTDRDRPSPSPPPELRVVQGDRQPDPKDEEADDGPPVAVRVVRMGQPGPRTRTLHEGQIEVIGESWQTIRFGRSTGLYRVHCDQGELHVAVDDDLVLRLQAGQSGDVEGAILRVQAATARGARGRYLHLGS